MAVKITPEGRRKYNHSRLLSSSADERVSPIRMLRVSSANDEGYEVNLFIADRPGILQHDGAALRRTSKVERRVTKRHTVHPIQPASVQCCPVRRGASNEGVRGGQIRLGTSEEGEADDPACCEDDEEPWICERPCEADECGLERDGVVLASGIEGEVQKGSRVCRR